MYLKTVFMKKLFCIFIALLLIACKKDTTPYITEFTNSQKAWNLLKASVNNSYSYVAYYGSVFGGYQETKITVQNGKVTGRAFLAGIYPANTHVLDIKGTWIENAATLGTHQQGAPLLTLDDIYAKGKSEWLSVDKTKNDVIFETDARSLIATCGYVPNGCMDDCFSGVHIKSITGL
jgi:hypothetical protein